MKLGKKEALRWETLAELFSEFAERLVPLEQSPDVDGPLEEEYPSAIPDCETKPEPDPEVDTQPDSAVPDGTDLAPSILEAPGPAKIAFQFDPTVPAQSFFASASWNGNSQVRPHSSIARRLHSEPSPAARNEQTAAAFFSQAAWRKTAATSTPAFIFQERAGLEKLMQVATSQAVSSSKSGSPAPTASAPSKARLFFSQAPWKKPA